MRECTPQEAGALLVIGTACLGLVILVLGSVIGTLNGSISVEQLGNIGGLVKGGGLLGVGLILCLALKIALPKKGN